MIQTLVDVYPFLHIVKSFDHEPGLAVNRRADAPTVFSPLGSFLSCRSTYTWGGAHVSARTKPPCKIKKHLVGSSSGASFPRRQESSSLPAEIGYTLLDSRLRGCRFTMANQITAAFPRKFDLALSTERSTHHTTRHSCAGRNPEPTSEGKPTAVIFPHRRTKSTAAYAGMTRIDVAGFPETERFPPRS